MTQPKRLNGKLALVVCGALLMTQTGCIFGKHGGPPGLPGLPAPPGFGKAEPAKPGMNFAGTTSDDGKTANSSCQANHIETE